MILLSRSTEYATKRFGRNASMAPLVLPEVLGEQRRILYTISEYDPLLDSSNMAFKDWVKIAQDVKVMSNQVESQVAEIH